MDKLIPTSAFDGLLPRQQFDARIRVEDREGAFLSSVTVRNGQRAKLAQLMLDRNSMQLDKGSRLSRGDGIDFVGTGPDSWLAIGRARNAASAASLREAIGGVAAVCDQSSAFGLLRIDGEAAQACLSSFLPIDLDPLVFRTDHVASTIAAYTPIVIWKDQDSFNLAIPRSYASSFLGFLSKHASSYGCGQHLIEPVL